MSEFNDTNRQPFSANINPNENYELQFWSKRFHVTPSMLKYAVEKVGTSADDIERFLKKQYFVRG